MARLRQSAAVAASGVDQASAEVAEAANSITALVDAIRLGGLVIGIAANPDAGVKLVERLGITIRIGTP